MHETIQRQVIRDQLRQAALTAWNHYQTTGLHLTEEEADAWLCKLENGEDVEAPACHI
jgi:predicted transcriptional regulator